ncbi:MBL fold metallo-hydrolase [Intrasporangium sp. YIM S08009]|uniref:MBL fold metallo-hydrolase n=1 Tax=Intrasporangium zincisolvens TaxID=3080018 RepID=UPI002B0563C5|nr:MBL fold metallo-hydrolase [Intrasporangium sp. YIM S08009]
MPEPLPLDTSHRWIHGSRSRRHRTDPDHQVEQLAAGTVLVRQSKDLTYEAPFVLLLLGRERALLVDTGAIPGEGLRAVVDEQVDAWTRAEGLDGLELVVAHSHSHGDHVAGDGAFADRPRTTVVAHDAASVHAFFGLTQPDASPSPDAPSTDASPTPDASVPFDLGGRVVDVLAIPGHHAASVAFHDRATGLLHTGDTVYPGRLYVDDPAAMAASLDRLVAFAEEHDVRHVLGCHVEMTRRPGRDYPLGARYQPDEPSPFLTVEQLRRVRDGWAAHAGRPGTHRLDDVVLCVGSGLGVAAPLLARAAIERVRDAVRQLT